MSEVHTLDNVREAVGQEDFRRAKGCADKADETRPSAELEHALALDEMRMALQESASVAPREKGCGSEVDR